MNNGTVLNVYALDNSDNVPPGDNNSKVTGDWTSIIFGGTINIGSSLLFKVKRLSIFHLAFSPIDLHTK